MASTIAIIVKATADARQQLDSPTKGASCEDGCTAVSDETTSVPCALRMTAIGPKGAATDEIERLDWFTFLSDLDLATNTYTLQLVNCAPGFYVLYPFQLTIRRDAHPPVIGEFVLGYANTTRGNATFSDYSHRLPWLDSMVLPLDWVYLAIVLGILGAASMLWFVLQRQRYVPESVNMTSASHRIAPVVNAGGAIARPDASSDKIKIIPLSDTASLKAPMGLWTRMEEFSTHEQGVGARMCDPGDDDEPLLVPVFSDQDDVAWREFFDLHIYRTEAPRSTELDAAATSVLTEIEQRVQRTRSSELGAGSGRSRLAGPVSAGSGVGAQDL
ncbi:hypothetical protein SPRG_16485 [Saprolegnia parasitica CBS 223.65]|uniref:Uncharacterized protein n=1 Tax=Saprolegnia parasitica (strain CBS 223.65) TaxID=695850 RepID=A0A067BTN6_SAPPC|nr:hypothetical protein SPRG_16485 [Saprolegnia parasitica CBS 223.65]KDO18012.1 hypothetical protein SPRG_16485 [Saprolegnia parasitica CBS 223.65]|eukprot:XP_012211279.1 hypothetical protein SPRG_16485 [Saprolegnia parasitica CBS 223.65]